MAYEVFDEKTTRLGSPALTIATDGRLALNSDAGDFMKGLGATVRSPLRPEPDEPDAFAGAPTKRPPYRNSGAIALPEPEE